MLLIRFLVFPEYRMVYKAGFCPRVGLGDADLSVEFHLAGTKKRSLVRSSVFETVRIEFAYSATRTR